MRNRNALRRAFTLFELVLALSILLLISGAVFSLTGAALDVARSAREEQSASRRQEGFLRITREAFQGIGSQGSIFLRMGKGGAAAGPEMVFQNTTAFGMPSMGDSNLVLGAPAQSDGSRVFSLRRESQRDLRAKEEPWVPLMAGVERVQWSFFAKEKGEWVDELPLGQSRPQLVRLNFQWRNSQEPVEAIFWLPPIASASDRPSAPQPSPTP